MKLLPIFLYYNMCHEPQYCRMFGCKEAPSPDKIAGIVLTSLIISRHSFTFMALLHSTFYIWKPFTFRISTDEVLFFRAAEADPYERNRFLLGNWAMNSDTSSHAFADEP